VTKPTGRPRGRPKTKEYVTLMARVDTALADTVKRYASLHRQPLSVVIRDALALLMEEFPPGMDPAGPQRLAVHAFLSDRYEAPLDLLLEDTDSAAREVLLSDMNEVAIDTILSDTNRDTAYVSDRKQEFVSDVHEGEAIVSDTPAVLADMVSDTHRDTPMLSDTNTDEGIVSDTKAAPPDILSDTKADDADYDPTKHRLGKLCPRKHDYRGTGQSVLRRTNHHCRACDREKFHERKPAKRQVASAT
jgi:hypothetical protein